MISESERDVKYDGGQDAGEKLTFDAVSMPVDEAVDWEVDESLCRAS